LKGGENENYLYNFSSFSKEEYRARGAGRWF
jgi:hypothetical protein